jgi:hypothetical protein
MSTFGAVFDLSSLDGSNGLQINGEARFDRSGRSVASAGDVNGDGYDDMIIGAYRADPNGDRSGAAYVVFGSISGFTAEFNLSTLDGTNGFQINGETAGDYAGFSVASVGDINGDGFDDLIIGAPKADPNGSYSGASYVVFGAASGFLASLELSELDGNDGFKINGGAESDWSGACVASAGDINCDGFDDLVIGVYSDSYNGSAYVVFGTNSGFEESLDLSSLDGTNGFQFDGESRQSSPGSSVASVGDINGDGFDDLIIGDTYKDRYNATAGVAYVVFGTEDGFAAVLDYSELDGTNGFRLTDQLNNEESINDTSFCAASAGDLNGDGIGDLIIGSYGSVPNGELSGSTYIVFGTANGFAANLNLSDLDGTNGFQISGEAKDDRAGRSVSSAGDVNGDGYYDLIIGAYLADPNGSNSGAAYVVFGAASGFTASLDLSDLDGANGFKINGGATDDWTGFSVSAAGDVNGDGFDDLIVGAGGADANGLSSGASYIIFGKQTKATSGDDEMTGASGEETISGLGGDDTLLGLAGNDQLLGGTGSDNLRGGAGNDSQNGGASDDSILGGTGADTIIGATGSDTLSGDSGADVVSYVGSDAGVTVNLTTSRASGGDAAGDVISGFEGVIGSSNADTLTGGATADTVDGGRGDDKISGADGADLLIGGTGKDTVSGGVGNDRFIFKFASESSTAATTADTITDFAKGKDKIDLSAIDAFTSSGANDAFIWIDTAAFNSTSKGEVRYEKFDNRGTANDYTMIWIDTDADRDVEMAIRLTGLHSLSSSDFIL